MQAIRSGVLFSYAADRHRQVQSHNLEWRAELLPQYTLTRVESSARKTIRKTAGRQSRAQRFGLMGYGADEMRCACGRHPPHARLAAHGGTSWRLENIT